MAEVRGQRETIDQDKENFVHTCLVSGGGGGSDNQELLDSVSNQSSLKKGSVHSYNFTHND